MTWHIVVFGCLVLVFASCFIGYCFIKALKGFVDEIIAVENHSTDYEQAMAIESMFSEDGTMLHNFNN